jgi:hypothetical protein
MDATNAMPRTEDTMQRAFEPRRTADALRTRFAAGGTPLETPPLRHLPPTRAARPARSRGVFFAGRWRARLGHWIVNAVCVALATLAIAASAHFAQPVLDAAARNGNAGPELVASATRTPPFLLAHAVDGPVRGQQAR